MTVPAEKIADAARKLSDLRMRIDLKTGLVILTAPQVEAFMVLVVAAPQIERVFRVASAALSKTVVPQVRKIEGVSVPVGFELDSPLFGTGALFAGTSIRVRNCLGNDGITTLRQLRDFQGHLYQIPGFGRKSLAEVRECLLWHGFELDDFPCVRST